MLLPHDFPWNTIHEFILLHGFINFNKTKNLLYSKYSCHQHKGSKCQSQVDPHITLKWRLVVVHLPPMGNRFIQLVPWVQSKKTWSHKHDSYPCKGALKNEKCNVKKIFHNRLKWYPSWFIQQKKNLTKLVGRFKLSYPY